MSGWVRCKFRCEVKTQTIYGFSVKMVPVTDGSPENKEFFRYTPSGSLDIGTINEESAEKFQVGREYYIDIIPADNNL